MSCRIDINEDLMKLIKSSELNQREIAEKTRIPIASLKQMLKARKFKGDNISQIADSLGYEIIFVKRAEDITDENFRTKLITELSKTVTRVFSEEINQMEETK